MGAKSSPNRKKGRPPKRSPKLGVTVLRIGVGKEEYDLPDGSTLADLLLKAGVKSEAQGIMIDGRPITELVALRGGMIISVMPNSNGAPRSEPWLETIGMFHDNPAFDEMMGEVEANRNLEREEG